MHIYTYKHTDLYTLKMFTHVRVSPTFATKRRRTQQEQISRAPLACLGCAPVVRDGVASRAELDNKRCIAQPRQRRHNRLTALER